MDQQQLREELRRIKQLINERPEVMAKFDKDGNGVIDGDEWEAVRQLVIRRLERKAAEAAQVQSAPTAPTAPTRTPPAGAASMGVPVAEGVVEEIAQHDARASVDGSVGDLDEMVFRQEGSVVGQMMESMVRRQYAVLAPSGRPVARIQQQQNEALQALNNPSILDLPELTFSAQDLVSGDSYTLTRRAIGFNLQIDVADPRGMIVAFARGKTALLRSKYEVGSSLLPHPWQVVTPLLRPLSLEITDAFDESRGVIQRQWSGLGSFLTGSNQMHLSLSPGAASRELRWGLVAVMLLADLAFERKT